MTFSNYDQILWRTIGSLLLLAIVIGLGSLLVIFIQLFLTPAAKPKDLLAVNQATQDEERLRLGELARLQGTDWLMAPLNPVTAGSLSKISYEGGYAPASNYFLFNIKTKESLWLWPSSGLTVFHLSRIYDRPIAKFSEEADRRVIGFVLEYADEKKAAKTSPADNARSLRYYHLATHQSYDLVATIDRTLSVQQTDPDNIILLYMKQGAGYFKEFNLVKFTASDEKPIALPH